MVNDKALPSFAGTSEAGALLSSLAQDAIAAAGQEHKREGSVTGYGVLMGEGAGGRNYQPPCKSSATHGQSALPPTALANAFAEHVGAKDVKI
jgi:hypothetical protein